MMVVRRHRQPEAEELELEPGRATNEHELVRAELSVDDALPVAMGESLRGLQPELGDETHGQRVLAEQLGQRAPEQQRHDQVAGLVLEPEIEDLRDAAMLELRGSASLLDPAWSGRAILTPARDLDRNLTVEQQVAPGVHHARSATAELALEQIAAFDGAAGVHPGSSYQDSLCGRRSSSKVHVDRGWLAICHMASAMSSGARKSSSGRSGICARVRGRSTIPSRIAR